MPIRPKSIPKTIGRIPANLNIEKLRKQYPVLFPFRDDIIVALSEYWFRRSANRMNIWNGFVSLYSKHLRIISDDYTKYIEWLVNANVWECNDSYSTGKFSKGFKWTSNYTGKTTEVEITDRIVFNAIQRLKEKKHQENSVNKHNSIEERAKKEINYFDHLIDRKSHRELLIKDWLELSGIRYESLPWLREVFKKNFDSDGINNRILDRPSPYVGESIPFKPTEQDVRATYDWLYHSLTTVRIVNGWEDYANRLYHNDPVEFPLTKYEAAVSSMWDLRESIEANTFKFKVSPTNGRINTTITQMPGRIRSYLPLDECNDLVSIDLTTAHLFFLLPFARELGVNETDIASLYDVIQKDLYGIVGQVVRGTAYTDAVREKMKKAVMFALYSENKSWSAEKDALIRLFGEVYRMVCAAKEAEDNSAFAVFLQSLESDFMIKLVGNQLRLQQIPVLTVHDCVIVKRRDEVKVKQIVEQVGQWYTGFVPLHKTRLLTHDMY